MSVGDTLDRGLKLLFARLPAFFLNNLVVLAPLRVGRAHRRRRAVITTGG